MSDAPRPDGDEALLPGQEAHPAASHIYEEARREAERHKWIESEKAGRDLGEGALQDWHKSYWRSWCRERWIEHLHGERYWAELDQNDYGILKERFADNADLASRIVERIKTGGENLDIIQWAADENSPLDTVISILKALDINSRRIAPPEVFLQAEAEHEEEQAASPGARRRVLVVDDDACTCQLLEELFESEGLECSSVSSGELAIEEFQKRRYHCYLVDLMLPGKHGAEVAWYLRRHGTTAPVIAISAVLELWNEDDLYDCGFTGIMSKPFELDELRTLAREIRAVRPKKS